MSIATGDKKISLRVGGKDLALNDGFPLSNPEKFKDTKLDSRVSLNIFDNDKKSGINLYRPTFSTSRLADNLLEFENSQTNVICGIGVGSSGTNHGIYSSVCAKDIPYDGWLIRATDKGEVYIYGKLIRDSKGNWRI